MKSIDQQDGQRHGIPAYRTYRSGLNIRLAKGQTERRSTRLQDGQKDRVSAYRTDRGTEYPPS